MFGSKRRGGRCPNRKSDAAENVSKTGPHDPHDPPAIFGTRRRGQDVLLLVSHALLCPFAPVLPSCAVDDAVGRAMRTFSHHNVLASAPRSLVLSRACAPSFALARARSPSPSPSPSPLPHTLGSSIYLPLRSRRDGSGALMTSRGQHSSRQQLTRLRPPVVEPAAQHCTGKGGNSVKRRACLAWPYL